MYATPYTSPAATSYTLAATFFAFLPFLLHLFSVESNVQPKLAPAVAATAPEPVPAATAEEPVPAATAQEPVPAATADEPVPAATAQEPAPGASVPAPGASVPAPAEDAGNVLGPILTYLISDLEMSILQLLDQVGCEMSTRQILHHFSDDADVDRSDLNRCLYRMHEQFIVCMRKENGKPLWSIPA